MYWLGIAGSTLTHEQRILAQRSSLSQPHPPQKFRAFGHAQRASIAVERVAVASSRVFRDEAGTLASRRSVRRLNLWFCISDVRRAAHPRREEAKQQWHPTIP